MKNKNCYWWFWLLAGGLLTYSLLQSRIRNNYSSPRRFRTGAAKAVRSTRRFAGLWCGAGVSGAQPLTVTSFTAAGYTKGFRFWRLLGFAVDRRFSVETRRCQRQPQQIEGLIAIFRKHPHRPAKIVAVGRKTHLDGAPVETLVE